MFMQRGIHNINQVKDGKLMSEVQWKLRLYNGN